MFCDMRGLLFLAILVLGITANASVEFCFNPLTGADGVRNIRTFYGICEARVSSYIREPSRSCFVFTDSDCHSASPNYYDSRALAYYFGSLSVEVLRDVIGIVDVKANESLPKPTPPLPWPKRNMSTVFEFSFPYQEKCTEIEWKVAKILSINANRIVIVSPCREVAHTFQCSIAFSKGHPSSEVLEDALQAILENEKLTQRLFSASSTVGMENNGVKTSNVNEQKVFLALETTSSMDSIEKAMKFSGLSDWQILWLEDDGVVMNMTENSTLLRCLLNDWPPETSQQATLYLWLAIIFLICCLLSIVLTEWVRRTLRMKFGSLNLDIGSSLLNTNPPDEEGEQDGGEQRLIKETSETSVVLNIGMTDIGLCTLLCGGFIGSFYLWPEERRSARLIINNLEKASLPNSHVVDRNEYSTIKRRLISFIGCTGVAFGLLEYLLRQKLVTPISGSAVIRCLFSPEATVTESLCVTIASGIATLTLFSGPLFEGCVNRGTLQGDRIVLIRNLVVCPLGEELFFRALLFEILRRRSTTSIIFISSVLFALSHSHHIILCAVDVHRAAREEGESIVTPLKSWKRAACSLLGLYLITFLYGLLSGYYYSVVCRYNLPAVVLSHSLCNMMGPPGLTFLAEGSVFSRIARASIYVGGLAGWIYMVMKLGKR